MLTIDYGDVFPQVYHRQRWGTVRAYFMQQRLAGPQVYENMGRQDITADVNFTDVIAWGESLGWRTEKLATQREFLLEHVQGLEARASSDPAVSFLMDEHGAGTAFKVLIQRPR
jgi:SAM-dependent MidA family methyltransferase